MSLQVTYKSRRVSVPAAANDSLAQVAQRAAAALKMRSSGTLSLSLRRGDALDHAAPLGTLRIPNNATLELSAGAARGPAKPVRVQVRAPGGKRATTSVPSDTTLRDLLDQLVGAGSLDADVCEAPTLQVMRRSVPPADLGATTLADLGLASGSAAITLTPATPVQLAAARGDAAMDVVATEAKGEAGNEASDVAASSKPPAPQPAPAATPQPRPDAKPQPQPQPQPETKHRPPQPQPQPQPQREAKPRSTPQPDEPPAPSAAPAQPPASLETCREGLQILRNSHFDADSRASIHILMRLVRNMVQAPERQDRRRLRRTNERLRENVFERKGVPAFLAGLGFAPDLNDADAVVLPDPNPHEDLLKPAYGLLAMEAQELEMEVPPLAAPARAPAPAPTVPFDPFKSMSISLAPRPKSGAARRPEQSLTSRKLADLEAQREAIVMDTIEDRDVVCIAPSASRAAAAAPAPAQATEGAQGGDAEDVDEDALVLRALRQQMVKKQQADNAPLKTQAVRQVEKLSKKKVYAYALLRLTFPDKYVLQAKFSPRETIGDVVAFLSERIEALAPGESLTLSDPPRRNLDAAATLEALKLVPAARLIVGSTGGQGAQLLEAVRATAAGGISAARALASYPEGVRLGAKAVAAPEAKTTAARPAAARESKRGGARQSSSGKPKWLKI